MSEVAVRDNWKASEATTNEEMYRSSLSLISDIGFNHDGYEKAEDLKRIIDELCEIAKATLEIVKPKLEDLK